MLVIIRIHGHCYVFPWFVPVIALHPEEVEYCFLANWTHVVKQVRNSEPKICAQCRMLEIMSLIAAMVLVYNTVSA